jgi:hypothetical protein
MTALACHLARGHVLRRGAPKAPCKLGGPDENRAAKPGACRKQAHGVPSRFVAALASNERRARRRQL